MPGRVRKGTPRATYRDVSAAYRRGDARRASPAECRYGRDPALARSSEGTDPEFAAAGSEYAQRVARAVEGDSQGATGARQAHS
jgi:hypothetical protein